MKKGERTISRNFLISYNDALRRPVPMLPTGYALYRPIDIVYCLSWLTGSEFGDPTCQVHSVHK